MVVVSRPYLLSFYAHFRRHIMKYQDELANLSSFQAKQ
jgi:hypothetical protein